jgi:hypothetical protein
MSVVEREEGGRQPSDAVEMVDGGRRRSDVMETEDGDCWSNGCGGERRGKAVVEDHATTVRTPRGVESDFSGRTQQRSERNTRRTVMLGRSECHGPRQRELPYDLTNACEYYRNDNR